jgi:hypothetical protein
MDAHVPIGVTIERKVMLLLPVSSGRFRAVLAFLALISPAVAQSQGSDSADTTASKAAEPAEGFHWESALEQSAIFLGAQHAVRMTQAKTRAELSGPYWSDYFDSVTNLHTWRDGDGFRTNYLAHPLMGAIAGDIEIFNDPSGRRLEFDLSSKRYWQSRLKAMAWSAAYSAQFEIGPISEASIGNVGIHPPTMAVVDLVVTPLGGFTAMLLEDYLDQRFVSRWELGGGVKARLYRVALNPGRSLANLLRWKKPWYRDNRPL